jgi:hypothetical protein
MPPSNQSIDNLNLVPGVVNRITGWAWTASIGIYLPSIDVEGFGIVWTGSPNGVWEYFDISVIPTGTRLRIRSDATVPTYTENVFFDDIQVTVENTILTKDLVLPHAGSRWLKIESITVVNDGDMEADGVDAWLHTPQEFEPVQPDSDLVSAYRCFDNGQNSIATNIVETTPLSQPVIADDDMEAVGVASWQAINSATRAKVTDFTPNDLGVQAIEVSNNSGLGTKGIQQVGILTQGEYYRLTGWAKTDGTYAPKLGLGTIDPHWVGDLSTEWQRIDVTEKATASDGVTWTSRTSAADNSWLSVVCGESNGECIFVAVASSGTDRVMTSPDGITWTSRTSAVNNSWGAIAYGNGLFVAVATSGTGNRVMTSPDGHTATVYLLQSLHQAPATA